MAYNLKIPFYAFKLHLSNGNVIRVPLMDAEALRINEPFHLLAGRYAESFQRKVLDKGDFQQILNEFVIGDYSTSSVLIKINPAKDKISYPAFELEFDFFYTEVEKGFWGIVPVLGVESFAANLFQLADTLEDSVFLEFARKQRSKSVQSIITAIWHETVELEQETIDLRFPDFLFCLLML